MTKRVKMKQPTKAEMRMALIRIMELARRHRESQVPQGWDEWNRIADLAYHALGEPTLGDVVNLKARNGNKR